MARDRVSQRPIGTEQRGMARDRPSPYGEVPFSPVARGPVPRDRWIRGHGRWRGTGPRPTGAEVAVRHGEGQALALQFNEGVSYFDAFGRRDLLVSMFP